MSSSALFRIFHVWFHFPVRKRCLPLYWLLQLQDVQEACWSNWEHLLLRVLSISISLVLGMWPRDVHHLLFLHFSSVLVELDLAKDFLCCAHCQRMLRLLSLRTRFPLLSICLDFCHFHPGVIDFQSIAFRLFSFIWLKEVISSSRLFLGLHTGLFVWCMVLRLGCPSFIWSSVCFNPARGLSQTCRFLCPSRLFLLRV